MLSLRELRRVVGVADATLRGARLDKLIQLDDRRLVLSFRAADGDRRHLLLSCDPASARLSAVAEKPKAPRTPPPFAEFLRARLGRATCTGVRVLGDDRQAVVSLRGRDGEWDLLLSILGPRSNVYALDGDGILRASLRPLARTRKALALGEPWRSPDTPAPAAGEDRWQGVPDAELTDAVEAHYAEIEAGDRAESLRRRLEQALERQGRGLERKLSALRRDWEAAGNAEVDRRHGELLKSALDRVSRGASEVEVEDWETGEPVRIALDPKASPQENLEALFKRYRKRLRARDHLTGQIGELEARLAEHEALAGELRTLIAEEPPDADALERFADRAEPKRLLARYAPKPPTEARRRGRPAPDQPARLRPRRYRSQTGLEIWVGRSDEGNDRLSTRLARGKDLFFHLDGSPGSHVVLRTEGRQDPPSEALLEAAELAVHFSREKETSRADVHVAPIANVSKPKGAKPGLVLVTGGRTLQLRRDPARLARILATRVEEDGEA